MTRRHHGEDTPPSEACAAAREAILTAEPEELEGRGETDLARHVRDCPPCGRVAREILEGTAALDRWLDRPGRAPDVEAILSRARLEATEGSRVGRHRRVARWALPLTAAAALTLLYLAEGPRRPGPVPPPRVAAASPSLDLEVEGGASAAVFQTDNPDITVVWFMQGGD